MHDKKQSCLGLGSELRVVTLGIVSSQRENFWDEALGGNTSTVLKSHSKCPRSWDRKTSETSPARSLRMYKHTLKHSICK